MYLYMAITEAELFFVHSNQVYIT